MQRSWIVLSLMAFGIAEAADWPRFRGPNGSGVAEISRLPTRFGPKENLAWRVPVPPGGSSPVVSGQRVFLTAYEGATRIVLCIDALTGKLLWRQTVEKTHSE